MELGMWPLLKAVRYVSPNKYIKTGIRMFSSKYIILTYKTIEKDD
jgi:hypothetical protein